MKEEEEEFINSSLAFQLENFQNEIPSVNEVSVNTKVESASEESYEEPISNSGDNSSNNSGNNSSNNSGNNSSNNSGNNTNNKSKEVCLKNKEDCMFGCSKETAEVVEEEKKEPVKTDLNEMMKIIEDTEKICDQIEEKDRERKEREERDAIMKQIELNKKFLVQQKAQDKQIKDLEEIVKAMSFTHEMNHAAVEKCGKTQDDCLTDKEKALKKLLLEKQKNTRKVHINLNFKDFGKEFIKHLTEKLGLTSEEMQNLLALLNSGELNIDELKRQLGYQNQNFNNFSSFSATDLAKQRFLDKANNQCHTCKVDLSEYIDRCKIPCRKCRDPRWKCPQDIKK